MRSIQDEKKANGNVINSLDIKGRSSSSSSKGRTRAKRKVAATFSSEAASKKSRRLEEKPQIDTSDMSMEDISYEPMNGEDGGVYL